MSADNINPGDLASRMLLSLNVDHDNTLITIWRGEPNNFWFNQEALNFFCTTLERLSDRLHAAKRAGDFNLGNVAVQQLLQLEDSYTIGPDSLHTLLSGVVVHGRDETTSHEQPLQTAILAWKNELDGFLDQWKEEVEGLFKTGGESRSSVPQTPHADRSGSRQSHGRPNSSANHSRFSGSTKRPSTSLSGLLNKPNDNSPQALLTALLNGILSFEDFKKALSNHGVIEEVPEELYAADDVPAPARPVHLNGADGLNNFHSSALPGSITPTERSGRPQLRTHHPPDSQVMPDGRDRSNTPNPGASPAGSAVSNRDGDWFIRRVFHINAVVAVGFLITAASVSLMVTDALVPTNSKLNPDTFALMLDTIFAIGSLYAFLFEIFGNVDIPEHVHNLGRSQCVRFCAQISLLGTFCTLSFAAVLTSWAMWVLARHTHAEVYSKALVGTDNASKLFFLWTLLFFLLRLINLREKERARAPPGDLESQPLTQNRAPVAGSDFEMTQMG